MDWLEDLLQFVQVDDVIWVVLGVYSGKVFMVGRVLVLSGDYQVEVFYQFVGDWYNLIVFFDFQGVVGVEIVLYINIDQCFYCVQIF